MKDDTPNMICRWGREPGGWAEGRRKRGPEHAPGAGTPHTTGTRGRKGKTSLSLSLYIYIYARPDSTTDHIKKAPNVTTEVAELAF